MDGDKMVLPTCSWNKDSRTFDIDNAYYEIERLKTMHLRSYHNQENRLDKSKCILFSGVKDEKEIIVDMTSEKLFELFVYKGIFKGQVSDKK